MSFKLINDRIFSLTLITLLKNITSIYITINNKKTIKQTIFAYIYICRRGYIYILIIEIKFSFYRPNTSPFMSISTFN